MLIMHECEEIERETEKKQTSSGECARVRAIKQFHYPIHLLS